MAPLGYTGVINSTSEGTDDCVRVIVKEFDGHEFMRNVQFAHAGWILSLALGDGSYSDGRNTNQNHWNRTMEVALIRPNGDFVSTGSDTVAGHVPVKYLPILLECLYADVDAEVKEAEYASIVELATREE